MHFDSKEELAAAIIDQGWSKTWEIFNLCTRSGTPGLENVVLMTFALADLMRRDKSVWIANRLDHGLGRLGMDGRRGLSERARALIEGIAGSIRGSDIHGRIAPETFGNMVWITVHGCQLLSEAMTDDVFERVTESWQVILPAVVPADALPYFRTCLERSAAQFGVRGGGEAGAGCHGVSA